MADTGEVDGERRRLVVARDRFEREARFLEHERVRLLAELAALREPDETVRRELAQATAALAREQAAHAQTRAELAQLRGEAERAGQALDHANRTLREINASLTFRAARPLHRVVNRLRELTKSSR